VINILKPKERVKNNFFFMKSKGSFLKMSLIIDYPNKLEKVFEKLNKLDIKPMIIGGYIRDKILNIDSKDIDIELYGVNSFDDLVDILQEFGDVNVVGKSFGVCKLKLQELEIDFSLPRIDSKSTNGHKGFDVKVNPSLDFKTAASRRDFTINAIGYDVKEKKLLDPFHGIEDLKHKILKAVDLQKFAEDPLRILRGVGFSTRLQLTIDTKLFELLKSMVENNLLQELAKERVFIELKKILLKSPQPSCAFTLLKQLQAQKYFKELYELNSLEYNATMQALDRCKLKDLTLLLAALTHKMKNPKSFLLRYTNNKKLIDDVTKLILVQKNTDLETINPYTVYKLATQININQFTDFLQLVLEKKFYAKIEKLKNLAQELDVVESQLQALLQGKDLVKLGLQPSKEFSKILNRAYEMQMRGEFSNKEDALKWLQSVIFP
jgi:tRNA nucleotidyltransferase (CCA-adding enzyme)